MSISGQSIVVNQSTVRDCQSNYDSLCQFDSIDHTLTSGRRHGRRPVPGLLVLFPIRYGRTPLTLRGLYTLSTLYTLQLHNLE